MLTLYSAPRTRSIRIAWLLEEMRLPYTLVSGEFRRTGSAFYIQDTPTGKYPTIDDDGFIMVESCAIAQYLLEKYGDHGLMPKPGDPGRGEFLQWMHFADATAFSPLGIVAWLTLYRDDADRHQELVADAKQRARSGFIFLDEHLRGKSYLVNETFSAADIMNVFTLMSARAFGVLDDLPDLVRYLDRLTARESFRIAAEKTGNVAG